MKIDLIDLDCEITYQHFSEGIGGSYSDTGELESIPASVTITSIKSKGIEIIELVPKDTLAQLEQEFLDNIHN